MVQYACCPGHWLTFLLVKRPRRSIDLACCTRSLVVIPILRRPPFPPISLWARAAPFVSPGPFFRPIPGFILFQLFSILAVLLHSTRGPTLHAGNPIRGDKDLSTRDRELDRLFTDWCWKTRAYVNKQGPRLLFPRQRYPLRTSLRALRLKYPLVSHDVVLTNIHWSIHYKRTLAASCYAPPGYRATVSGWISINPL